MAKPSENDDQVLPTAITPAGSQTRSVTVRHSGSLQSQSQDVIAEEVAVALSYNGQSHAVMMASPMALEDFAIGFSLTERIIDTPSDILSIDAREAKQGFTVDIRVHKTRQERLDSKRRQIAGRSGCGICGITELAEALPELPRLDTSDSVSHRIVSKAVDQLQNQQQLQQSTGAVHAAALIDKSTGELLLLREDVGRHNALDKLIGAISTQHNVNTKEVFVLISSRASHELVSKCAIAGIDTLVSISAATTLAIDVAARANINVIGFVRGKRQILYHQSKD